MKVFGLISVLIAIYLVLIDNVNCLTGDDPLVTTLSGKVKGKTVNFRGLKVDQFLNIPFAEPPLNDLRFRKPIAKRPWTGVLSANGWGPHCMQGSFHGFNTDYEFSEDCLVLNVFTPHKGHLTGQSDVPKLRSVMVWIHGGGFTYGSANFDGYNGTTLVATQDIVFVSINYRLGAFGFLHLPQHGIRGNIGLWDQILALQWIKDNIKQFGGDPERVTIFGESAGSISVAALIISPAAKGLFSNAIMQSGSIYNIDTWYDPKASELLLEKVGCSSASDMVTCLQTTDAANMTSLDGFVFWPIFGDDFLPNDPTQLIKNVDDQINILLGVVGVEGAGMLFSLDPNMFNAVNPVNITIDQARASFVKLYGDSAAEYFHFHYLDGVNKDDSNEIRLAVAAAFGDTILTCPTYAFGYDAAKRDNLNVFAYYQSQKPAKQIFSIHPPSSWMPATHGDDVPFMFGFPLFDPDYPKEDVILSIKMLDVWGNFAKTGKPSASGFHEWPQWRSSDSGEIIDFVMDLNSEKLGQGNNKLAKNCHKQWPFPINKLNMFFSVEDLPKLDRDEL